MFNCPFPILANEMDPVWKDICIFMSSLHLFHDIWNCTMWDIYICVIFEYVKQGEQENQWTLDETNESDMYSRYTPNLHALWWNFITVNICWQKKWPTHLKSIAHRSLWYPTAPLCWHHWCCKIQYSSFPPWCYEETLWHLVLKVVDKWKKIQSSETSLGYCPYHHWVDS